MSKLVECIATREWSGWKDCVQSWDDTADKFHPQQIIANTDVLSAYQICYKRSKEPILAYIHDDVMIYEKGWDSRVLSQFDDPGVGMVGWGGGLGHGVPHLYEVPYYLPNLARQKFLSNLRNAEVHGKRFTGERDIAVVDGFAVFVRRSILDAWGGFPQNKPVGYFMWCENLCCETRRQGYRIRLVGIDCDHLGGRTSSIVQVKDDYEAEHEYFYKMNSDVMPFDVELGASGVEAPDKPNR
jgi:hypothetical protein